MKNNKNYTRDYNFLEYKTTDILSCKRLEELVLGNKYLKTIPKESIIYQLMIKALNKGSFSRFAKTDESALYWMPLSNAGMPTVPRDSYMHETKFLLHDLFHQLMPDIIIDTMDPSYEKIYIMYRMMGEAITMFLADYITMDILLDQNIDQEVKNEIKNKKIYATLNQEYKNKDIPLIDMLKNHIDYAVLGTFKYKENINNFDEWCNNVFVGDYNWTVENYRNMLKNGNEYINWGKSLKHNNKIDSDLKFLTRYSKFIDLSDDEILEQLFFNIFENLETSDDQLIPLDERVKKANNICSIYNSAKNHIIGVEENIDKLDYHKNEELEVTELVKHFLPNKVSYFPSSQKNIKTNFELYNENNTGLFVASFDICHYGHLNAITEASKMVDKLYIGVGDNHLKNHLFTLEERISRLKKELKQQGIKNYEIIFVDSTAKVIKEKHIDHLFRGVRNAEDFKDELFRVEKNKKNPLVNIILLFGNDKYHTSSSSLVKKIYNNSNNQDDFIKNSSLYISNSMAKEINEKLNKF